MVNIQKRSGFIQNQKLGLLAQRAGQQHTLLLPVTDLAELPLGQIGGVYARQGVVNLFPVGSGQKPQPPGVGVAPGGGHLKAGDQPGAAALGEQHGHAPGGLWGAERGKLLPGKHGPPAQRGNLARNAF